MGAVHGREDVLSDADADAAAGTDELDDLPQAATVVDDDQVGAFGSADQAGTFGSADQAGQVGTVEEVDGNRIVGGVSRAVLEYVARSIVDDADSVVVDAEQGRGSVTLRLHVAPDDMGRVIGRRGRVAQAIRTVVRAAGASEGVNAEVDIVD